VLAVVATVVLTAADITASSRIVYADSSFHGDRGMVTHAQVSDATQCADVLFVGVRGSGQEEALDDGFGAQVNSVRQGFLHELTVQESSATVRSHAFDYHAADIDVFPLTAHNNTDFLQSVQGGIERLSALLRSHQSACPHEKVVLAGYSQGALVAHGAVQASPEQHSRIAALLLISDPAINTDLANLGNTERAGTGAFDLFVQGAQPVFEEGLEDRSFNLCNNRDIVCDASAVGDRLLHAWAVATHRPHTGFLLILWEVSNAYGTHTAYGEAELRSLGSAGAAEWVEVSA